MSRTVVVAGVGMIPFTKPGQSEDWDVMAEKAVRLALADAVTLHDLDDRLEHLEKLIVDQRNGASRDGH